MKTEANEIKELMSKRIINSSNFSEDQKQLLLESIDKLESPIDPDAETLWKMGISLQKIAGMKPEMRDEMYEVIHSLYEKSAQQGNAAALRSLGQLHMMGYGVEKSEEKAIEYYTKASELGSTAAQIDLGVSYYLGAGVEKNPDTALIWLKKAAENGNADALWQIGSLYFTEKRFDEARPWFQKAAEAGCDQGFYTLGIMYRDGAGVEKDAKKGFEYLLKGAQNGEPDSQCHLALARIEGKFGDYSVQQDTVHSIDLLRSAVAEENPRACYYYGRFLAEGEYVEKNIDLGMIYLTFAASNYIYEAQSYLSAIYYEGDIVERDPEKCFYWAQCAAKTGKPDALQFLALLYADGFGVEENAEKGIELLKKCVDLGDESSQRILDLYFQQCKPKDDSQDKDHSVKEES